ncbi:hypothetical protein JW859_01920 [bacterium]|nr:hypothetical protein [bacterium]
MARAVGIFVFICVLIWAAAALAEETYLQWDDGVADTFTAQEDRAHWMTFVAPDGWTDTLCSAVTFFGRRYGDVTGIYGTVVVYAPPAGRADFDESTDDSRLTVLSRNQFMLQDLSEEGSWLTVEVNPVAVGPQFGVAIYTYSNDERGAELGLTAEISEVNHSGWFYMTRTRIKKDSGTTTETADHRALRNDGREWLIRAYVSTAIAPAEELDVADLSGPGFAWHDDGTAEGYYTSQKHGPMVLFDAGSGAVVDRVYVNARVEGAWFESTREASVYLLDSDLRILQRKKLAYSLYATEGAWRSVAFDDIKVAGHYYVLVEPVSRPEVSMYIGCDESGENLGSEWATAGSILAWNVAAPEESANWMIRAHYK